MTRPGLWRRPRYGGADRGRGASRSGTAGASPAWASRRAIVLAVLVGMLYIHPAYLVGAFGVAVRTDLGLDSASLGLTISVFFAVGAAAMPLGGLAADRLGPRRALRLTAALTGACLVAVALFGGSWPGLLVAMAVGGVGSAIGAPLGTLLIVRNVRPAWRPLAFGLERSSLPASTLLAGLAPSLLTLGLPWRLVFLLDAAAVVALLVLRVPDEGGPRPGRGDPAPPRTRLTPVAPLVLLTLAYLLCSAAATALSGLIVDYGARLGMSQSAAGGLLALGSLTIIAVRLALGLGRGRRHGRFTVAGLMVLGAAGFALLIPGDPALVLPGVLIASGAGWGWTSVAALALAETYPAQAGRASGVVQAGGAVGGIAGPLLVGTVAEYASYPAGWALTAACCGGAAFAVLFARAAWNGGAASAGNREIAGQQAFSGDGSGRQAPS